MPRRVNREELLKQLEAVSAGLSPRDIIEQSSCFVFQGKKVITFNGEAACWSPCSIGVTGAVSAKPLLEILRKMQEEHIEFASSESKLVIHGKQNRRARIPMEAEITLPFQEIKEPKKWNTLPADFLEAVDMVHRCCGKDTDRLETFVHLHKEKVEAIGEHQVGHFRTRIDLPENVIVHKDSVKHVVSLGMTEVGVTDKWVHFRNPTGLVLSCLKGAGEEDYPSTEKALSIKGKRISLPRGLDGAVDRASVFSRENPEDSDVTVFLKPGKVIIVGASEVGGDWREPRSIDYKGEPMEFLIDPKLLQDICRKHHEAWVTQDVLKVKQGKFTFVTALGTKEDKKEETEAEESSSED